MLRGGVVDLYIEDKRCILLEILASMYSERFEKIVRERGEVRDVSESYAVFYVKANSPSFVRCAVSMCEWVAGYLY